MPNIHGNQVYNNMPICFQIETTVTLNEFKQLVTSFAMRWLCEYFMYESCIQAVDQRALLSGK